MNLETKLEPKLWDVVRGSLEGRKFTNAILDAIYLLSDVIRERSGLDGDGVQLVGAAFGGDSPKLKVSRLQTESEKNVQRGIESLLRGVYQAIRNPRSHGAHDDNERDAAAILLFLDYLLRIVDKSRSPFSLSVFLGQILDPAFVPKERYAVLLVKEIPARQRLTTSREVFARRDEADPSKVRFFFSAILKLLSLDELAEFCQLISEELQQTDDEGTIRFVLQAFELHIWTQINEIARLRVENKLIESIRNGKWVKRQKRCTEGAFGTWATNIIDEFALKDDLWRVLATKLGSSDVNEQDYVFNFFLPYANAFLVPPPSALIRAFRQGLKAGDSRFKKAVDLWTFLHEDPEHPWRKPFLDDVANFTAAPEVGVDMDAEIPF